MMLAPGDGVNKKNDCYYFVEMYIDRGRTIKFRSELDFHCRMEDDRERERAREMKRAMWRAGYFTSNNSDFKWVIEFN